MFEFIAQTPEITQTFERMDWEAALPPESNEAYHARKGFISSTQAKWITDSPWHYNEMINLEKHPYESKHAFDFGSCAHESYLEQRTDGYAAYPPGLDRRTKEGKALAQTFNEIHKGKKIISHDDLLKLHKMFDVIASDTEASELVSDPDSMVEKGFLFRCPDTGLPCKARPDILNLKKGFIADYKTIAGKATPHVIKQAAVRYFYHFSAAHYLKAIERIYGETLPEYIFVAQEKDPPFAVVCVRMTPHDLARSFKFRREVMETIAKCTLTNSWPRRAELKRSYMNMPDYAFNLYGDDE